MKPYGKILLLSVKIGLGSSMAIYIAQLMHLDHAISAGTVTLLTLMTTKWQTVRLSISRLATFLVTITLTCIIFPHVSDTWTAYGILLTLVVLIAETLGLRATISVNSVVIAHMIAERDLSAVAIRNEFLLVLIGVAMAMILNLFHANITHKKQIVADMRDTEYKLQSILKGLGTYLSGKEMQGNVWDDICALEKQIQDRVRSAQEYQDNTFHSHPQYYISYFEMRSEQCYILHNLHDEMVKILSIPKQAKVISEYIFYLADYVIEINAPDRQIARLNGIFESMRDEELPKTREEFEDRALLYHILMDIQDFLLCKAAFVDGLDETQLKEYWRYGV